MGAAKPLTVSTNGEPAGWKRLLTIPVCPAEYPVARLMWLGEVSAGSTGIRRSATCPSWKKRENPPAVSLPSR